MLIESGNREYTRIYAEQQELRYGGKTYLSLTLTLIAGTEIENLKCAWNS